VGDRSRGRFATPADFPQLDCSPCSHVHVRRERLGVVHQDHFMSPRAKPLTSVTIRNFSIADGRANPAGAGRPWE
jgi:hypothetical protein